VLEHLVLGALLAALIVLLFLGSLRSTLIAAISIPVSIISTFGLMKAAGFTLNLMTLLALALAVGIVIDDAIVVLENIVRHREQGVGRLEAALRGAREIGFTVLSISISLIAVFIPILLMGGLVGRLFREFAMTLSAAIVISMVVSLTTTPMMCATLLPVAETGASSRLGRLAARAFDGLLRSYDVTLSWALRHRRVMLAVAIASVAVNAYLFAIVPKGFFPQQDNGRLTGAIQAAQDTSFQAMQQRLHAVVGVITEDPAVGSVIGFTGGSSGPGGVATNVARLFISLKPLGERKLTADQVIARLRPKLAAIPGAPTFLQSVQDLRVGGRASNAQYQYTLQGEDVHDLEAWAPRVASRLSALPQLVDFNSDQQDKGHQTSLVIDRSSASRLGLTAEVVDNTLYDAFGQRQVSTMYTPLNQYHVVMEVAPRFWQRPDTLRQLYVRAPNGNPVPLSAFGSYAETTTPLAVNHQSQFPSVTLSFNLAPGVSLGDAVNAIETATRQRDVADWVVALEPRGIPATPRPW